MAATCLTNAIMDILNQGAVRSTRCMMPRSKLVSTLTRYPEVMNVQLRSCSQMWGVTKLWGEESGSARRDLAPSTFCVMSLPNGNQGTTTYPTHSHGYQRHEGWHPENPEAGICPKNPHGILGIKVNVWDFANLLNGIDLLKIPRRQALAKNPTRVFGDNWSADVVLPTLGHVSLNIMFFSFQGLGVWARSGFQSSSLKVHTYLPWLWDCLWHNKCWEKGERREGESRIANKKK